MAACIFCKIIKGEIPCFKLVETEKTLAFLDINPLSRGHALVIPKHHGEKLLDIPDDHLADILPIAKKLAKAVGTENYNILQNNGRLAHQEVDHIPKPNATEGLGVGWPQQKTDMDQLKALFEDIKSRI
ncbi:Adenosine 5'-monophosphoramidase [Sporothrix stenoceras]|uniref:Adenosine 5'-monophosphoramidase n=1 Tax=Sporothrix stenoceras TaxID=5173 RepID=A0ABR3YS18_9PEZI